MGTYLSALRRVQDFCIVAEEAGTIDPEDAESIDQAIDQVVLPFRFRAIGSHLTMLADKIQRGEIAYDESPEWVKRMYEELEYIDPATSLPLIDTLGA